MIAKAHTLYTMLEFINKHKNDNIMTRAYPNTSDNAIASELVSSMQDGTMRYATNNEGEIVGVVTGKLDRDNRAYELLNIVTSESWVLGYFIGILFNDFSGCCVKTLRKGKERILYPNNLERILTKL